jgi:CheY-like chemotaxis protein
MSDGVHSILVVDDDEDIRGTLCDLLREEGYATIPAANGQEALDLLRDARVCVILLDLMMPVMNGWRFRDAQRADPQLAAIPVVVVTASGKSSDSLGSVVVLHKPLRLDSVLDAVRVHCPLAA